ncbi:hypothetical protein PR202_gb14205 [Eleusine coracana subsp. coracana]|uniref:Uncharacterized protein n=1 Tax=Eleusine coracana subsp. coracana TaxID=191504 RepID=A0AAV5EUW0_ELECO|nr:hypothetical protein PR202_gb14205 [Eleusine coracana subsp. coracana]
MAEDVAPPPPCSWLPFQRWLSLRRQMTWAADAWACNAIKRGDRLGIGVGVRVRWTQAAEATSPMQRNSPVQTQPLSSIHDASLQA